MRRERRNAIATDGVRAAERRPGLSVPGRRGAHRGVGPTSVVPFNAILDENGDPILDETGNYILEG